ncbi:NgoFVII family restriction endonuclease [Devosia sp. Root413D1]|nr:NgoFVII family restriction endonuclease [Devosia sp. Root413D1]
MSDGLHSLKAASAYVTMGGTTLLLNAASSFLGQASFAALPKKLVTSFDFGLTEPAALHHWMGLPNTTVMVAGSASVLAGTLRPRRAFHPKLYAFERGGGQSNVLVGSANLTGRGFSINTEVAWVTKGLATAEVDTAFAEAERDATPLTAALLASYEALRAMNPPPPPMLLEVEPVPEPPPVVAALGTFRVALDSGAVDPAAFGELWVQGEALQGGSGNQLELPRGANRFFGFAFADYDFPDKKTIGKPVLRSGSKVWTDRLLTWHGNNKMERLNLPTVAKGGYDYANSAVLFRRLPDGSFEVVVTPWNSDLRKAWQSASAVKGTIFRLGSVATNRLVGLL